MRICMAIVGLVLVGSVSAAADEPAPKDTGILFREGFEDGQLQKRGWYDGRKFKIAGEAHTGSGCIEYHWNADTTTPESSSGLRHLFEPTDTVYLRFSIKLSKNWGWSGRSYHPHLMHFMTTENGRFHGPAASHLTLYIEPQNGRLRLAAQDIQNKDAPHGLTQGPLRGGYNGKFYDSQEKLFTDDKWHTVEALFKLNTLDTDRDRPNADGLVRGWFDGKLVIDRSDVIFRSTDFPKMKFNQYLLTPYFGRGLLPHEQTLWIDDLVVATKRLEPVSQRRQNDARRGSPDPAEVLTGGLLIGGRPAVAQVARSGDRPQQTGDRPQPPTAQRRKASVRVASVQAKRRLIDWRIQDPEKVLAAVDDNLAELEAIVRKAGERNCDVLAFPEDTLGLLNWYGVNEDLAKEVLPVAVERMLDRLGRAAASHQMYLVVCSDFIESDGATYNTAFFLGRDGKRIGRYHKTCPTWGESASRNRGKSLPVFATPDLGTVGMLICYDLVFPETARCLALAGADMIFFPTMGGAAVGDDDIGLQALRVRAAENHVYLVVAFRSQGAMIISPRGKIIARAEGPDGMAIADINPLGGREGGDAMNHQRDMRARLFRERNPAAFGILTDPNPPVLKKIPIDITRQEAGRIAAGVLTVGEEEFRKASSLARAGKTDEAIAAFSRLRIEYRGSWIDRVAAERLQTLREANQK